jgi:hypothetical protein
MFPREQPARISRTHENLLKPKRINPWDYALDEPIRA